jgi:hypothetical protein
MFLIPSFLLTEPGAFAGWPCMSWHAPFSCDLPLMNYLLASLHLNNNKINILKQIVLCFTTFFSPRMTQESLVKLTNDNYVKKLRKGVPILGYLLCTILAVFFTVSHNFFLFLLYSYVHTMFGSFLTPSPHSFPHPHVPSLTALTPLYQAETILPYL